MGTFMDHAVYGSREKRPELLAPTEEAYVVGGSF
jgi:hypothetical protein